MMLHYYNALERLKKNTPNNVPKGCKITKASVAREAGRDPSAIKVSRPEFSDLIHEITKAGERQAKPLKILEARYEKLKKSRDSYKIKYENSLGRELLLIRRVRELEEELGKL